MVTKANHFRLLAMLAAAVTAGLVLLVWAQKESAAQAQQRPNVVFIKTDDQPESTLSQMPNVKKPHKGEGAHV